MTMLFSPIISAVIPTLEGFTKISDSLSRYRSAKAQKARVAKHVRLLTVLDAHMLNDIGMNGFNCLTNEEQEGFLLKSIQL